MAITLQPYNTINLAANTPTQLVAPTTGHYYIQILNNGPGAVQIAQTGPTMSSYFTLGGSLSITPFCWGPDGIWVSAPAAVTISVALISNTATGAPTGAGAVTTTGGQTPWISNIDAANHGIFNVSYLDIGTNIVRSVLEVRGAASWPTLTSDPQIVTISTPTTAMLTIGSDTASPYGGWLQMKDSANAGHSWPLLLNPVGGNVGIGLRNPTYTLDVTGPSVRFISTGTPNITFYVVSGYLNMTDTSTNGVYLNGTQVQWRTNGLYRWTWIKGGTETGTGNAGSDLTLWNFNDAGTQIGSPIFIYRSSGLVGINNTAPTFQLDVGGSVRGNGRVNLSGLQRGTTVPGGLVAGDLWADTSTTPPTVRIV